MTTNVTHNRVCFSACFGINGIVSLDELQKLISSPRGELHRLLYHKLAVCWLKSPAVGEARMAARSGGVRRPSHAQHVPNNRCTNQNHLLSISLTFSLDALPAAHFFTPGTRLILQSTHEPPKLWVQLAGHQLLLWFMSEKTKDCTSLKHISKQYHLSQTLFWTQSTLVTVMSTLASPLFLSVFE